MLFYLLFILLIVFISVRLCLCERVPPFCRRPQRPEESVASPTAAVAGSCGPPTHLIDYRELHLHPPQEQPALLTSESPLHLFTDVLVSLFMCCFEASLAL